MGTREQGTDDVIVERFSRRTIRIGSLVSGVEKTIEYDTKIEKPTRERVKRTSEGTVHFPEQSKVEYRKFREAKREHARDRDLSSLARKQTIFTLTDTDGVSYREFVKAETMYLVSQDNGATVRIMDEEELNQLLGEEESEDGTTPTDVLDNALDRLDESEPEPEYDTDVPEQTA